MKSYYRVMLGQKSVYTKECFTGNFIGTDFGINQDLTNNLPEEWRAFNKEFMPVYLAAHPDKTKIGAGLACGTLWTVSRRNKKDGMVLCPEHGNLPGVAAFVHKLAESDWHHLAD